MVGIYTAGTDCGVQVNDLYFAGAVLNCLSNVPAVDSASLDKNTKGNVREKMEKIEGLARRMRCEKLNFAFSSTSLRTERASLGSGSATSTVGLGITRWFRCIKSAGVVLSQLEFKVSPGEAV
jgi:hypothetical protein